MLKKPIAMLLEGCPRSKERSEPAHQHMDFLFILKPLDENQVLTSRKPGSDMRWFSRSDIEKLDDSTEIFANVKEYVLKTLRG